MHKVIILGVGASRVTESLLRDQPSNRLLVAESLAGARELLDSGIGDILLISRDVTDLDETELLHLSTVDYQMIIWPPDHLLLPLISHLASQNPQNIEDESPIDQLVQSSEELIRKNLELTTRITALEAVVRSLIAALSQYDPAIEAYAGEKDAWELMMLGLPAAGLPPEEYLDEEEYIDSDENEEDGS